MGQSSAILYSLPLTLCTNYSLGYQGKPHDTRLFLKKGADDQLYIHWESKKKDDNEKQVSRLNVFVLLSDRCFASSQLPVRACDVVKGFGAGLFKDKKYQSQFQDKEKLAFSIVCSKRSVTKPFSLHMHFLVSDSIPLLLFLLFVVCTHRTLDLICQNDRDYNLWTRALEKMTTRAA